MRLTLEYQPPFDWNAFLGFHRTRAIEGLETVAGDNYRRVLRSDGEAAFFELGPGSERDLVLTIHGAKPSAIAGICTAIRKAFDLDRDPREIARVFAGDPVIGPLVRRRPGMRVPGLPDPFEQAVRAILGQQISVSAACALGARLCERWGQAVTDAPWPGLSHAFPAPQVLATADVASLGMPGARGRAVSTLARAVLEDPDLLGNNTADGGVKRLLALRGIGDWTANYIAMRALRDADAFPAGDVGLQRALADSHGQRPTTAELRSLAERWRPLRAYAAQYLWQIDATLEDR